MWLVVCSLSSEDVPRLYDLVKPKDDKYRPAFYFALRNTLVASDLEQATRIGMKVGMCKPGILLAHPLTTNPLLNRVESDTE